MKRFGLTFPGVHSLCPNQPGGTVLATNASQNRSSWGDHYQRLSQRESPSRSPKITLR